MRRARLVLVLALAAAVVSGAALVWVLDTPRPPAAATHAERVFLEHCAECHGADGHGSWRAALFLIRPGDLTDPGRTGRDSSQYLFDIVKNGGAPIGRPGMPAFGAALSDDEIHELVMYVRTLGRAPSRER